MSTSPWQKKYFLTLSVERRWDEMSGLDVLDEERGLQLREHHGGQNICTLVCIHWLWTPRHEVKWMHYAEAEQFNVFHVSLLSLSLSPRWVLSPLPPPGSCGHHRVLLTRPQASGGGSVLLTGTSQVKKSSLSVMDTHHILITGKENVHQPIRTIILRQCLLLLTLIYP